jgi:hypothetical protein
MARQQVNIWRSDMGVSRLPRLLVVDDDPDVLAAGVIALHQPAEA